MIKSKYKAILFDFDGTLFDTWPALATALQQTYLRIYNKEYQAIEELKPLSILPRTELLRKLLGRIPSCTETEYFVTAYQKLMLEDIRPYPGVQETIALLDSSNIPWGIVTNKPKIHMRLLLEKIPYLNNNACVICPEDVTNRKPHPEPILKACNIINCKPEETLYIGDTHNDIQASQASKTDFVFAAYGYSNKSTPKTSQNTFVIERSLIEIKDFFLSDR